MRLQAPSKKRTISTEDGRPTAPPCRSSSSWLRGLARTRAWGANRVLLRRRICVLLLHLVASYCCARIKLRRSHICVFLQAKLIKRCVLFVASLPIIDPSAMLQHRSKHGVSSRHSRLERRPLRIVSGTNALRPQHHGACTCLSALPPSVRSACLQRVLGQSARAVRASAAAAEQASAPSGAATFQSGDLLQAQYAKDVSADTPETIYLEVLEGSGAAASQKRFAWRGQVYRQAATPSASAEGALHLELVGRQVPAQDPLLKSFPGWAAGLDKMYAAQPAPATLLLSNVAVATSFAALTAAVEADASRWINGTGVAACIALPTLAALNVCMTQPRT